MEKITVLAWILAALPLIETPALGGDLKRISIGYPGRSLTDAVVVIAKERKFFEDEGFEALLVEVRSTIVLQALVNGELDYTTSIALPTITAAAKGLPVKVIAGSGTRPIHVLMSQPQVSSVSDLKGKKIAIPGFGTSVHLITKILLRRFGIDPSREVQWIVLGDTATRLQAFKAGQIDATAMSPPSNLIAQEWGMKMLARFSDYVEIPFTGLATTDAKLMGQRDEAKKVIRAVVRGAMALKSDPEGNLPVLSRWLKVDRKTMEKAFDLVKGSYSWDGSVSVEGLSQAIEVVREEAAIREQIRISKVADFALLREVQMELFRKEWKQ